MALHIVPLSGILMGVLVLGLIFLRSYTQRKQPQLCSSKGPRQSHIDRPHFSGACCAVLHCATDRQELLWRSGDHGFSLKNTTVSSTDYTATGKLHREDTLATSTAQKCSVTWLELSNKAYSWRSLKTSVHKKKKDKTFLMEMIDRLFTEKSQFSWCLEMSSLFVRAANFQLVVEPHTWSRPYKRS